MKPILFLFLFFVSSLFAQEEENENTSINLNSRLSVVGIIAGSDHKNSNTDGVAVLRDTQTQKTHTVALGNGIRVDDEVYEVKEIKRNMVVLELHDRRWILNYGNASEETQQARINIDNPMEEINEIEFNETPTAKPEIENVEPKEIESMPLRHSDDALPEEEMPQLEKEQPKNNNPKVPEHPIGQHRAIKETPVQEDHQNHFQSVEDESEEWENLEEDVE